MLKWLRQLYLANVDGHVSGDQPSYEEEVCGDSLPRKKSGSQGAASSEEGAHHLTLWRSKKLLDLRN